MFDAGGGELGGGLVDEGDVAAEDAGEELNYERLEVVFDTDLTIFTYTADPGTRSADALNLLGSLAATTNAESASAAP